MKQRLSNKLVSINFSSGVIIFFIFLEGLTVPLVAISNNIMTNNMLFSAASGFIVAAICILFLFKVLKKLILKHSKNIFSMDLINIEGISIIGFMAGILLMVMFIVQFLAYSHGSNDYLAGFLSGFLSVFTTLYCYEIVGRIEVFTIKIINSNKHKYQIHFKFRDIIVLSLIFGIYELIVCPITAAWIPFTTWRIPVAILSGIIGGGIGGGFLYVTTNVFKLKLNILLKQSK